MATYCLVHGAWHGGWCWRRISPILQKAGHKVFCPTLTGLGDRAHLASPEIDLECHIQDVIAVIETEEETDVILCGHSYGGQVITNGQSLMDVWPDERAQEIREQAEASGDGWKVDPLPPEYFGVMDRDDAEWVNRRCVPQPIKTFSQPIQLSGAWENIPKKLYLLASLHPNSRFERFSEKFREKDDWDVRAVDSGHDVMIDTPDLLAEILLELA